MEYNVIDELIRLIYDWNFDPVAYFKLISENTWIHDHPNYHPIFTAVKCKCNTKVVKFLIDIGEDVNKIFAPQLTSLYYAFINYPDIGMAQLLLNHGAKLSLTSNRLLYDGIIEYGNLFENCAPSVKNEIICEKIDFLVKNGVDFNFRRSNGTYFVDLPTIGTSFFNAFLRAVLKYCRNKPILGIDSSMKDVDSPETVRLLAKLGVNLDTPYDKCSSTRLGIAIISGDYEMIKVLLECGASINAPCMFGKYVNSKTPIEYAYHTKNYKLAHFLIKHSRFSYPLLLAYENDDLTGFTMMVEKIDSDNLRDAMYEFLSVFERNYNKKRYMDTVFAKLGRNVVIIDVRIGVTTLFHSAAKYGFDYILKDYLIPDMLDAYGRNVLFYAKTSHVIDACLAHIKDINLQDHYGDTALHFVSGNPELADEFIKRGANLTIPNNKGMYPADIIPKYVSFGAFYRFTKCTYLGASLSDDIVSHIQPFCANKSSIPSVA